MRKVIIFILLFIIICLSLSMDCFTTGGKRTDFSYNPDKANADLISKTDLSKYVGSCNNVGVDYKNNKLYLAYGKDILQFDSNSLAFETKYNISLDVTYDYNITSITHDSSYFYILANEYDQTGDVIRQFIIKYTNFEINNYYVLNDVYKNKILSIKYDKISNKIISHSEDIKYYSTYEGNNTEVIIYTLYSINLIESKIIYEKYIEDNQRFSTLYSMFSFCTRENNLFFCTYSFSGDLGIDGYVIKLEFINNRYISEYSDAVMYSINTSYLGDDDYVCIYDMVFDGTYLWCLVNNDDKDAYITGNGIPYLLKLNPRGE